MPYIKIDRRPVAEFAPETAGELNFAITTLITSYMEPLNYQKINDIIGALDGAKMEFYRRVVVPYEDKKIQENGDVF